MHWSICTSIARNTPIISSIDISLDETLVLKAVIKRPYRALHRAPLVAPLRRCSRQKVGTRGTIFVNRKVGLCQVKRKPRTVVTYTGAKWKALKLTSALLCVL